MSIKNDRYTYRVTWSEEDQEYVGLCTEFPSLSWLSSSPEKALKGIRQTVNSVVKDIFECNESIPEALSSKKYSGKFMVCVSPDIHKQLAIKAAEKGISLNHLASSKLSQ